SAPATIEFGWTPADLSTLNEVCEEAATTHTAATAACTLAEAEDGPCGEADPDETACEEAQEACATLDSAGDDCQAAWPLVTAPLFAERPDQGTSWGIGLDSSGSDEKIVVFAHAPAAKVTEGTQRTDSDR